MTASKEILEKGENMGGLSLDPIENIDGYSVKRGDAFKLGYVNGSKVRQTLHLVEQKLDLIRSQHGGVVIVGASIPSYQTAVTAQVANHYGLGCIICMPRYKNDKVDLDRVSTSICQKLGAKIYGVSNPYPSGYQSDVAWHIARSNPYEVSFSKAGYLVLDPIIHQVQNVPEYIDEITLLGGSGMTALGVLIGLQRHRKTHVKRVNIVYLSGLFHTNKTRWYDPLPGGEKFQGELNLIESSHAYRAQVKKYELFDYTYEAKAWDWLVKNRTPSLSHLFWVVGVKNRDLSLVEPIAWLSSDPQRAIDDRKSAAHFF